MANCFTRKSNYPKCVTRKDYINFFPRTEKQKGYLEMADVNYADNNPAVTYDYIPPQGNRRDVQEKPINRIPPNVTYDDRSIYRQEYTDIRPPYHEQLPWKPDDSKLLGRPVRGTLPGFYGPEYINPHAALNICPPPAAYESSGAQRMREKVADEVTQQGEHNKKIPEATMTMPSLPVENYTEYRSTYCKTVTKDDTTLPDVRSMTDGFYKYYHGADNFSYNSQHRNRHY